MGRGVYIVGEDPVTRAITMRIIREYAPALSVIQNLPARGSAIKSKILAFNVLALSAPVIMLCDLDNEPCAPIAKERLLSKIDQLSPEFVVNIAVDEAEAWLFADRDGFAEYFGVPPGSIPCSSLQRFMGSKTVIEVEAPVKSSYYLTHCLIKASTKPALRAQVISFSSCKGKEYNSAIVPFVEKRWNIEVARKNSDSLNRMIMRVARLCAE